MALAKNTKTGLVVKVPSHYLGHPVLGKNLVAFGEEAPVAPKEKKNKEQPAPVAEPVVAEQEPIINENEEQEDGN